MGRSIFNPFLWPPLFFFLRSIFFGGNGSGDIVRRFPPSELGVVRQTTTSLRVEGLQRGEGLDDARWW